MSYEQKSLATEAVEFMLKSHGWNDEEIQTTINDYNEEHTNTPPHEIELYRSNCIDLSLNNDMDNNNLYFKNKEQQLSTQKKQNYQSIPLEQKVKDLEFALRLAKERIGDLWMELYNERKKRTELEKKLSNL